MKEIRLPASDLTFGQKCKCCFWAKHNEGWREPWAPFPTVFAQIDKAQKAFWTGRSLSELEATLPAAELKPLRTRLKSVPIVYPDLDISLTLTGEIDLYGSSPEGSVIVDAKTTSFPTKPEDFDKLVTFYGPQLMLYRHATMHPMHPAKFHLENVTAIGLLVMGVEELMSMELGAYRAFYAMEVPHRWVPIPINDGAFAELLRSTAELLAGHQPPPGKECHWCELRDYRKLALLRAPAKP